MQDKLHPLKMFKKRSRPTSVRDKAVEPEPEAQPVASGSGSGDPGNEEEEEAGYVPYLIIRD